MPRPLRLDYANARHHVMNRGARREAIFLDDQDCVAFLDLLGRCTTLFGVHVHGYALMGNHYHLLVATPHGNLSEAMSFLQGHFARRQNRLHSWDGPLLRGRYRNRVVEDDRYWMHLLAYVHLNPVSAQLVARPEDARWTSHRAYLGLDRRPDWLDTAELLSYFGGVEALAHYVHAVQIGRERGPEGFSAERLWRPEPSLRVEEPARPPAGRSVAEAMAELSAVTGRSAEALRAAGGVGTRGNPGRWLTMWWLQVGAGLGTNAIARHFGVGPAVVSRAIARARREEGREFVRWRETLEGLR